MMLRFRTLVFQAAFYLTTALYLVACLPLLFLPIRYVLAALRSYGRTCLRLVNLIARLRIEVRGYENLPDGASIVASKHQSTWETFALFAYLKDPVIIMKHELFWIPVHGWFALKFRMIPAKRGKGRIAIEEMVRAAKTRVAEGREIIIFPEGTRRLAGADPAYRNGIVALYEGLDVPCCPVALNSGVYWPRRSPVISPGKVILSFLEPIAPGLTGEAFKAELSSRLEEATDGLIREALASPDAPPVPDDLQSRFGPGAPARVETA